jgi:hypothetical protein
MRSEAEAVLITGVYGTGKTSVAGEIAATLERWDAPYAAIDLDWLIWANVEGGHGPAARAVLEHNVAAVIGNYRDAGLTLFVLAGYVQDADAAAGIARAVGVPMRIVRLTAPLEVIERRVGSGRDDELDVLREAVASGVLDDVGDLVIDGDRPLPENAAEVLDWLGWLGRLEEPMDRARLGDG